MMKEPSTPTPSDLLSQREAQAAPYLRQLRSGWKMRFYFFTRLPSAFFWGARVQKIDPDRCVIRLPYNWFTKNPFRSIYFAAQCGAAELSTGLLATLALQGKPPISMLVLDIQTRFVKKASSTTTFTCQDGPLVWETIEKALQTGAPQTITMESTGRDKSGDTVSVTRLTWSFKMKKNRN